MFRGDAARSNPAELLVAALSACHQLWYLHLCADAGIVVVAYSDDASGVEVERADGAGQFESVTLRPHAKLAAGSDENIARRLHDAAAEKCFIALSVVQGRARTDVRDCVGIRSLGDIRKSPSYVRFNPPDSGTLTVLQAVGVALVILALVGTTLLRRADA